MDFPRIICWTLLTPSLMLLSQLHVCRGQLQLSLIERRENQIVLMCTATSAIVPQDEWKFWIEEPSNVLSSYSVRGRGSSTITIAVDVTVVDEGLYYCGYRDETSNPEGEFTTDPRYSQHEVTSLYRVGMHGSDLLLPNPVPLPNGDTRRFYNVTWTNFISVPLSSPTKYNFTQNGSAIVSGLTQMDSGQYSLKIDVANPVATAYIFRYVNSSYSIFVQDPPSFTTEPKDVIKMRSEFVFLLCEAIGYPNITIQWTHNGHTIGKNSKYAIMSATSTNVVSSRLNINALNATDNGNITCIAQINGCDAEKSYANCELKMFPVISVANLAVITNSFTYTALVVEGGNLQIILRLKGNLIPVPVHVYIQYTNEGGDKHVVRSAQTNMDLIIPLYIRRELIPYEKFHVKLALGTDRNNSGLYKSPMDNRLFNINSDDKICNIIPWIVGIVVVIVLAVFTILLIITTYCCIKQCMKNKHELSVQEREHEHEIQKLLIKRLSPEKLEEIFPKSFGATVVGDGPGEDSIVVKPQLQKIREWMDITDEVMAGISDTGRKRALITLLANTVKAEDWYNI